MIRSAVVLFAIASAAVAASHRNDGQALFNDCEFKAAADVFERRLISEPASASLHFWAGKSYARMAEVSTFLSGRRNARKAQAHLETAVRLDPQNREYRTELFEFYVDSPEWFDGGLARAAAILDRLGPDNGGPGSASAYLAASRKEYGGAGWALRKGIVRLSGAAGNLKPRQVSGVRPLPEQAEAHEPATQNGRSYDGQ